MEEINKEIKTMFTTEEIEAIRDRAEEAWAKENFPVISIEQRHAELTAAQADPSLTYIERERLVRIGSDLLDSTIDTMVSAEMTDMTDEDRIALRVEKITARFEPLIPHLTAVTPEVADEFASLALLDQLDSLTSKSEPVGATASFLLMMDDDGQKTADSFEAMHRESVHALQDWIQWTRSKAVSLPENEGDDLLHDLHVEDAARYRGKVLDESTVTWRIGQVDDDGDGLGSVWMVAEGQWVGAPAEVVQELASL